MRASHAFLALATLAMVAGCSASNSSTTTTPTPNSGSPSTSGTTSTTPSSGGTTPAGGTVTGNGTGLNVTLDALTANPPALEITDQLIAAARVTNHGAKSANPGVQFWIDGGSPTTTGALLGPGAFANITATLVPLEAGDHILHARLDTMEKTVTFHVKAPQFTNVNFAVGTITPCQAIPYSAGFTNAGDGKADGAFVNTTITYNGQQVSVAHSKADSVPAGMVVTLPGTDAAFKAACNGAAPRQFTVHTTVEWRGAQRGDTTSTFTA